MNDESNIQAEQIVDRAVGALRDAPVPPGPPPETLQAVLAAGGTGAQRAKHKTIRQRIFTMNRLPKIAASILILAGVAALVWVLGPGTATVAWADVQERIRNLHTLTCRIRVERKGQAPFEGRMMFKEPGLIRQEMTKPLQCINIFDLEEGKGLSLISKEKIAVLMDMSDLPQEIRKEHEDKNYLAQIKELVEKSGQELGEKQIGQRRAKGYKVEHEGELFTVWVDAETGDPLEMEMKLFQDQGVLTTSNFEFDKPLDDKLFSLEVPEGYEKMGEMKFAEATAEEVAGLLRTWAGMRGGTFPDAITPQQMAEDVQHMVEDLREAPSEEDPLKFAERSARVFVLLDNPQRRPCYAGKGVKLGDAETAIFWYKPEDSETYKVIYGDLSIKEVAEEDLPAEPAAGESAPPPAAE